MGEDNPGMVVYYNLLGLLYDPNPIRDRVAGTVESISHITAQTLYDCHRVFYAPSNMVLCVEGCVDPETVARIARDGFDGPALERARRAVYGSWLRGLDRFDDVCIAMAEGLFGGYEHMDAFPLLGEITAAECAKWLTETLAPERLALSVVAPKGGEDDADDDA